MSDTIENALNNIYIALDNYMEFCIYGSEFKELRERLDKNFELIETTLIELCEELTK